MIYSYESEEEGAAMLNLNEYIDSLPIISTHEHHFSFHDAIDYAANPDALEKLFGQSYVAWANNDFKNKATRSRFLDLISGNSYFIWYEKALDDLFNFGGEITVENWDAVSDRIGAAYADPGFQEHVWKDKCCYTRAILDAYWAPGADNGRPDLYAPTFRVNSFFFGINSEMSDSNGYNAQRLYGTCGDLDEYSQMIDRVIREAKDRGCVALKSAIAYDRSLDFASQNRDIAAKAFGRPSDDITPDELNLFGNYVYDQICSAAARYELPFQNHTGLGKIAGSNPMNLIPMIEKHPHTKFVLFHGGYPWTEQLAGLSHNYYNVYTDICWLPAICTSAAKRLLHSLIETAKDSSRITWGGDSWLVTESYAQTLAARHVIKNVLSEKVADGYLSESRARRFAERILSINAKELYGL